MKKIRSLLIKALGVIICAIICLYNYSAQMRFIRELPNDVYIYDSGEGLSNDINIQFPFSISGGRDEGVKIPGTVRLLGREVSSIYVPEEIDDEDHLVENDLPFEIKTQL